MAESKARRIGFSDKIEAVLHIISQVPLACRRGPVSRVLEQLDESDLIRRKRPMQLLGSSAVRVTASDHA